MKLCDLSLQQFRNMEQLHFEPSPFLNVIFGQNGQGKTNLLESIWLLTGGKSFRGGKDAELIQKGAEFAKIEAAVLADSKEEQDTLQLLIAKSKTAQNRAARSMGKNGSSRQRPAQLAGVFPAVVFAPNHLTLVKGSPDGRRRFLDAALCQLYPGYLENLRRYTRLITQKNALLKQEICPSDDMLEAFDRQLATAGSLLIEKRIEYIQAVSVFAQNCYRDLSAGREALTLFYEPSVPDGQDAEAFLKALHEARRKDRLAGFATAGPHRDDLLLQLDGEDAKVWASQGQQRSVVLALKIAEASRMEQVTEETPVLLLDDVLSELDAARQDFLLNRIEKKQVFVTSCETDLFTKTEGRLFRMEQGKGTLYQT